MSGLNLFRLPVALGLVGLLSSGPAMAGIALETLCLDCHSGDAPGAVAPRIEGQHAAYLAAQLQRFAERHREGFPMSALSEGLDAAAIARISSDLAERPWVGSVTESAGSVPPEGSERLDALDCASCHGADYRGGDTIPRIAGQHQAYLARQIAGFSIGDRHHPPLGGGMRMYRLEAEDIEALAATLSALE
ncbi:MAG: c-type cytochrome [Aquimonas sp.]|nr:c-type cytochrome [Aquimonas sp.]